MVPAKRQPFAVLFLLVWLCGWAVGEFFAARQVLSGDKGLGDLFLLGWLVMWTAGGAWAAYSGLWLAFGKEVISLGSSVLAMKHDILGMGGKHEYDLQHVIDLRVSPQQLEPFGRTSGFGARGAGSGSVAFDYGSKTIRFAAVEEAEAKQIVADLKARHSFAERAA